jgi:hypothetical protein
VLIVHGKAAKIEHFADRLIGLKGVQHGRLVMTVPAHAIQQHPNNGRSPKSKESHNH